MAAHQARVDQPKDQARRSNPLCAVALGGPNISRSLDDGRIEIYSNVVERSIRPIALNRKNALFAGFDGGDEHWAAIASPIETCKLTRVDPHVYLTDVISKIVNGHPNNRIDELLPWAYPASHSLRDVD